MDRVVAARKLLAELVKSEQLEVRRAEIVGRDLAQLVETLGRPPSGRELEDWLGEHPQVTEVYAGPTVLDELVYRHLTPPPSEPANVEDARHPELERQICEAPESVEPYLVYADWLQEHGDPMGELIALGVASASGAEDDLARFERHRKLHEARFFGGLARQLADRVTLQWRHGVVCAIEEHVYEGLPPAVWDQLMRLRVCGFVQSITLRRPVSSELDATIEAAASSSLRALTLEAGTGRVPDQLLRRELRELHVILTTAFADGLATVKLPRLERLALGIDVFDASKVPALVERLELPALVHLALCDGRLDAASFAELAKLPIAGRLGSLALTNLELTDDRMAAIASSLAAFTSLAELDVSYNELSREGLAIARAAVPNVVSRRQAKPGNAMERRVRKFAGSRLQAAEAIADPKAWRRAGVDGEIRWARYRGDADYELFVSADLVRYGCSCPSSIQPCKHVVALAMLAERTQLPVAPSDGIEGRVAREIYGDLDE